MKRHRVRASLTVVGMLLSPTALTARASAHGVTTLVADHSLQDAVECHSVRSELVRTEPNDRHAVPTSPLVADAYVAEGSTLQ
jgi:hypothetical protein